MGLPESAWRRDLLWALLLTAATQVELVLADGLDHRALQHLAFGAMTLAVALRRTSPLAGTLVCAAGLTGQMFLGEAPVVGGFLALVVLVASLGYHAGLRSSAVALTVLAFSEVLYGAWAGGIIWGDLVANVAVVLLVWGLARAVRRSTDARVAAEVARDRAAREAAAAERSRIARDLHDSVAHSLTLITLQAGAARERTREPLAAEVLATIESGGRAALVDMHRFLRLLGDEAPAGEAPGLRDLDDLLDRVRAGGLDVDLETRGDLSALPASVSATAYLVVQEGLTNAAKHAGVARARVRVAHEDHAVTVSVHNSTARDGATPLGVGSGRGLVALRERVSLFEGTLTAGREPDGWVLSASIPVGQRT